MGNRLAAKARTITHWDGRFANLPSRPRRERSLSYGFRGTLPQAAMHPYFSVTVQ